MKKDIEWLRYKLEASREVDMNKSIKWKNSTLGEHHAAREKATKEALDSLDQLNEPEVLSQEWIDENSMNLPMNSPMTRWVSVSKLQNLLVPKRELPSIPKFVAEWIEEMKQDERPLYSAMSSLMNKTNHEWAIWKRANKNFSEIVAQAWLDGFTVEEEPKYYALVKGHQFLAGDFKYFNLDVLNNVLFVGSRTFILDRHLTEMSKSEWNKLGINDSNADFLKTEDVEE